MAYRQAVDDVMKLITPATRRRLAAHDPDIETFDFPAYLRASEQRYARALRHVPASWSQPSLLDVGGYLAVFPLTLARLGHDVTVAERYDLYDGALDPVRDLLYAAGVAVVDSDLTQTDAPLPEPHDVVTCMAMLEHVAHSPKPLLENLRRCTGRLLVVDVPNVAYSYKRWNALKGASTQPAIANMYDAREPFTGHHREYTLPELLDVLGLAGFEVARRETFNYSLGRPSWRPGGLLERIKPTYIAARYLPSMREVLMVSATPTDASAEA